jgi:hypothetical protein
MHASPAFLLASNVVMEIKGETTHQKTTSRSASVGWEPFSVSSSSRTQMRNKAPVVKRPLAAASKHPVPYHWSSLTATDITTKDPQIISWISGILPAHPRINP